MYQQQHQMNNNMTDTIQVPLYVMEDIQRTLNLWANINKSKSLSTCLNRDTMTCILQVEKLLSGQEITGMERCEIMKRYGG